MFEEVLIEQNPHWDNKRYHEGIHRDCFEQIKSYLRFPHVISITGVRRSGKSTILKQLINFLIDDKKIRPMDILFVNLEHPYFVQYSNDVRYLEKIFDDYLKIASPQNEVYCFLDEIQFFANWPVFIKAHYEQKSVKFVITGSNSFLMSHELLTLLSGRTLPVEVYPLSFLELTRAEIKYDSENQLSLSRHKHQLRHHFDLYLQYGGFPEIALNIVENLSYDILNAYSKTILYQDVASRLGLKKPLDLERLFYYLTSHVGTPYSYTSLAKIFELSDKTVKEYVTALVDANLLFEMDKFSFSLKHQIRSGKKIYSIDTGIVNAVAFKFSANRGRLFENVIFLELKRRGFEIYYYKTASDLEVDFVVKEENRIQILQVCLDLDNNKTQLREVRALVQAAKELNLKHGTIITTEDEEEFSIEDIQISVIPLYKFLLKRSVL